MADTLGVMYVVLDHMCDVSDSLSCCMHAHGARELAKRAQVPLCKTTCYPMNPTVCSL